MVANMLTAGSGLHEGPPHRRLLPRKADVEQPLDPDLEAVGMVIKGSRLYVFGALWLISTSISMIFIKVG